MVRGCVRTMLGLVVGVALPAAGALAQDGPTLYEVAADQNGNTIARQRLPDGTVVPVDLSRNGIVLDPGDVGREFTLGGAPGKAAKGAGGPAVDVAQMREQAAIRLANLMKEALGCSDEEWNVLGPKIQAIQLLQSTLGDRSGAAGMDKAASVPVPSVMAVVTDLRAKQGDFRRSIAEQYPDQDVKSRLASVRESRLRARQELVRAQKELTELVTSRQEAVLVERRILE